MTSCFPSRLASWQAKRPNAVRQPPVSAEETIEILAFNHPALLEGTMRHRPSCEELADCTTELFVISARARLAGRRTLKHIHRCRLIPKKPTM